MGKKLAKETGKTDLQLAVLEAAPPPKEKKPMLKEVSGTLDRIKKLGAKNKEGQTREAMLKLFQQKKKEAIEAGEEVPSLLDKNVVEALNKELGIGAEEGTKKPADESKKAPEADLQLAIEDMSPDRQKPEDSSRSDRSSARMSPLERSKASARSGGSPDSARSQDSARSPDSARSTSSALSDGKSKASKLAGTILGSVVDKQKSKQAAKEAAAQAAAKLKAARAPPKDKAAAMLKQRSQEQEERAAALTDNKPSTAAYKAAQSKSDIKSKIEQFKAERKEKKKSGTSLEQIKKEGAGKRSPGADEVMAIEGSESAAAKDPKLAFMTKGAFFVTNTAKSNAATIKLALDKDFNHILWKEHTDKTEHRIELIKIVSISEDAVLRDGREKLAFSLIYSEPGEERQQELILEAISERAKKQWLGGLQAVIKGNTG